MRRRGAVKRDMYWWTCGGGKEIWGFKPRLRIKKWSGIGSFATFAHDIRYTKTPANVLESLIL
jgi:hypothetical protein